MQSTTIAIPTYDHTHTHICIHSQAIDARERVRPADFAHTHSSSQTLSLLRSLIHTPIDRSLAIILEGASGRPRERERQRDTTDPKCGRGSTAVYEGGLMDPSSLSVERRGWICRCEGEGAERGCEPVQKSNKKHLSF